MANDTTQIDLHLLDYLSEPNPNLLCPICRCPFVDPIFLTACEHCFCRTCLDRSWDSTRLSSGTCPTCRASSKPKDTGAVPRLLKNLLDDLLIRCPMHEECCDTELKRGDVLDHVASYCAFAPVGCPREHCERLVKRKDLDLGCTHWAVSCLYCKEDMVVTDLEPHWRQKCSDRMEVCDLCQTDIPCPEMMMHKRERCPASISTCRGSQLGCSFKDKRIQVEQHSENCVFARLTPFFETQARRTADMEAKQTTMARKINVLETGLESLETALDTSERDLLRAGNDDWHAEQIPHTSDMDNSAMPDPIFPDQPPEFSTPYTHLLALHESLRSELARVSAAVSELDGRQSMMVLNENIRTREEIAFLGGQVGALNRQVGWLTGQRLATRPGLRDTATDDNAETPRLGPSTVGMGRRITDEGRTKL